MKAGSTLDEMDTIRRLKHGETRAAGELMDQYGESLMRYLFSILGSRENSEDVFQETWLRAISRIRQF
jgi:DNA-directed RNA polymerase specialized sigma24 family protein